MSDMSGAVDKTALRAQMLQRRRQQDPAVADNLSRRAQMALLQHPAWCQAKQVALYVAVHGEVHTTLLLENAFARKRDVLLPRCVPGQKGIMEFVHCDGFDDVCVGAYGIWEPKPELPPVRLHGTGANVFAPDMLIVPAVAFDRHGVRMGYGGGYYDRFLRGVAGRTHVCMGLAYAWQIVDELPRDAWDYPMQCLCSEEGIIWV